MKSETAWGGRRDNLICSRVAVHAKGASEKLLPSRQLSKLNSLSTRVQINFPDTRRINSVNVSLAKPEPNFRQNVRRIKSKRGDSSWGQSSRISRLLENISSARVSEWKICLHEASEWNGRKTDSTWESIWRRLIISLSNIYSVSTRPEPTRKHRQPSWLSVGDSWMEMSRMMQWIIQGLEGLRWLVNDSQWGGNERERVLQDRSLEQHQAVAFRFLHRLSPRNDPNNRTRMSTKGSQSSVKSQEKIV